MTLKSNLITLSFLFIFSCSDLVFLYQEDSNLTNPLYNKTDYIFSGKEIPSIYRQTKKYFGISAEPSFTLYLSASERKIKKSVQQNQALSKADYELTVNFKLQNLSKECQIINENIFSNFSYNPKSSGYNFGSDQSLEKQYELAIKDILDSFIKKISNINISSCNNES